MRLISLLFLFFISISMFSQNKLIISGKVSIENKTLPDAIIELQINKLTKYSITDKKGFYKFSNINVGDTLIIKFRNYGYKTFIKKIENIDINQQIDINLVDIEVNELQEVVIKSKNKTFNSAKKSSYKIDNKNFIKNATANEVLNTVPNVFVNNIDGNVLVDGNLKAIMFIDGIEMLSGELKTINAEDIDRVEVINNPSSIYGSDFTGSVINIISKKKSQDYIKGSIEASGALRYNNWFTTPSISYKRGRVILKSFFDYKVNNQILDYEVYREDNNIFIQDNKNNTKGKQQSSQTRLNIKLTEKSSITFSNSLFGYKFIDDVNGKSQLNNDNAVFFTRNGNNSNSEWNINSVYNYKKNDNNNFFFKARYLIYTDSKIANFNFSDGNNNGFDIESKNKDFSFEFDYEKENFTLFNKESGFYPAIKIINRDFSFSNTSYYVNQLIINVNAELDTKWSKQFSTDVSLVYENTRNRNNNLLNQNYNYLLPTINALYHFKNKLDLKFGYSKKILRPSANDLNDALITFYPGVAKQGNIDLNPQIRNYYFFTLSKTIKSNNFSLKVYNESINNAIVDIYRNESNVLIQTLSNAAEYNSLGMNLGVRTKLFKKINTNLNTGFDYNTFEDTSLNAIIKKNNGYTFRGNINLSTNLFKDKVSVSFSGSQNGPVYSLLSKTIFNPYFDFRIATNIFKDKINISLYGQNIFRNANNLNLISNSSDFYQKIQIRNDTSNILLSIKYSFGKKFNDNIDENNIQNNDLRK
jgi:outer membrane cobalamin receptor